MQMQVGGYLEPPLAKRARPSDCRVVIFLPRDRDRLA